MGRLTLRQAENALWRATVLALGLDPDAESVQKRVRISWPQNETGGGDWRREENVVFLRVTPEQHDYGRLFESSYEPGPDETLTEVVRYTRLWSLGWICYGPDSGEDADAIRVGILRQNVREYMRTCGLAVLPGIREPLRVPETEASGLWWERHDLTAECYELTERRYASQSIEGVPQIQIASQEG